MSESKHTLGPWRTRRNDQEAPDDMIVMAPDGTSICDCSPGNPYMSVVEAEANARLIAAAAEMLEIVKNAAGHYMASETLAQCARHLLAKIDGGESE